MTEFNEELSDIFGYGDTIAPLSFTLWGMQSLEKIYCDLSSFPTNYWAGDIGKVTIPISFKTTAYGPFIFSESDTEDKIMTFIVISNTDTYFSLVDDLDVPVPPGCLIDITKDNIKQNTFSYSNKKERDVSNRVRITFSNQDDQFRTDLVEEDNIKSIEEMQEIKIVDYEMYGIKRFSQANRMAKFLVDYEEYVRWKCEFETDILGLLVCLGSIVGITRIDELGWVAKLFRVIIVEEIEELESKMYLLEYVPGVYHDYGETRQDIYEYPIVDKYSSPGPVRNLVLFESRVNNKIYVCMSRPEVNATYFSGALIYYKKSTEETWKYLGTSYSMSASCILSQDISVGDKTIYFDLDSVIGSFASSGSFFVGKEEIWYKSISGNTFINCRRGEEDSVEEIHLIGDVCSFKNSNLFSFDYFVEDIGVTLDFKAISVSSYGVMSLTGPEESIYIEGYYLLPYPVGLLKYKSN